MRDVMSGRASKAGPALLGGIPLADLGYGPAFVALATGDRALDPYLPPLGRLAAAVAARRHAIPELDRRALWDEVERMAVATGAPAAARDGIAALENGSPLVLTGQQPGLLGGPLFTLCKALSAIAAARSLEQVLGERVVPVFWTAADDSDFEEIASATVAGSDLDLRTVALDPALAGADRMVGALPVAAGREALAAAAAAMPDTEQAAAALALGGATWERGADWGEGFAALLYALLGAEGLVVIDARTPALRPLAAPLFARYLDDVAGYAATVDRAGEALARAGLGRQLGAYAAHHPLYREEAPRRIRLVPAGAAGDGAAAFAREARAALAQGGALWAGVALRPLAMDFALPVVARVVGPAEVAYLAQLAPAYTRLDLHLPPVLPRLAATLVPVRATAVAAATVGGLAALLGAPHAVMTAYFKRQLPLPARRALEELESGQRAGFARAREALGALGRGLDQLVDAVAARSDYQLGRLWEAAIKRNKSRKAAAEPWLRHLPDFLRPREGLQERRLATLGALALGGTGLVAAAAEAAALDLEPGRAGRGEHHLIGIE